MFILTKATPDVDTDAVVVLRDTLRLLSCAMDNATVHGEHRRFQLS
jgi:hypothetical protein